MLTDERVHQLQHFRDEIDHFMAHHPQSPLAGPAQRDFAGLNYYEPNPDLVLRVEVERLPASEPFVMQTSTGAAVEYVRYGRFTFEVDGQEATLTIYADPSGAEDFFLPFRDATSAEETYEAGRYLDNHRPGLWPIKGNTFEIDFNYAYNPYCAYSPAYSCPLPPRENWLDVPVRAGEKAFP